MTGKQEELRMSTRNLLLFTILMLKLSKTPRRTYAKRDVDKSEY